MAWTTSTLVAAIQGASGADPYTASYVMPLDNGDIWWFLSRTPNPTFQSPSTFGGGNEENCMAVMKLKPDYIERVSAGDEGLSLSYNDPGQYVDGSIEVNAVPTWISHMATDGKLIYMFGFYSQIKVFDPATLIVTTLAGASPTSDPGTWDSPHYRTIKDSHAGLSAWLGFPWGGLGVDRTNRNLYFFAKQTFTTYQWQRDVGGQLRRMSLDGEHAVTTLTDVLPDVTHDTNVVVYGNRIIFGTRNHLLGVEYVQGGYGLASCALDGSDYQVHYVDSDPLGAAKPTGFSAYRARMVVAGDYLIMNNAVGTKLVNFRYGEGSLIAFPIQTLLNGNRIHSHTTPLFETVVKGGLNVPKYKDGVDGYANYYMGNLASLAGRVYWTGLDFSGPMAYVYEYMAACIRTAVPSTGGSHNITVSFSGKAIKGYSAQHTITRSPPREVTLK